MVHTNLTTMAKLWTQLSFDSENHQMHVHVLELGWLGYSVSRGGDVVHPIQPKMDMFV